MALTQSIVASKTGCLIEGYAGSGKTELAKAIRSEYNLDKVLCLAPTNKAAQLLGGKTFHKAFGMEAEATSCPVYMFRAMKNYDAIFVDEISMVTLFQWSILYTVKRMYPNIVIYLMGDFYQCAPINTNDPKPHEYSNSPLLKYLTDCQHVILDKNQRSDDRMWNIQQKLKAGADVRHLIQKWDHKTNIYKRICYRNVTRRALNLKCQESWLKEFPERFNIRMTMAFDKDHKDGIEYILTDGMPVIAMVTRDTLGVVNNEEFKIQKITDSTIFLTNEYHKEPLGIPLEKFGRAFDLAFAITIHKSQGSSYDVPHVLHEWCQMGNDALNVMRLRYTGITRTRSWELLMIA